MEQRFRISVVVCTCNGALYLKEQLESIFRQTYPAWEVIVLDDRSTDDTESILSDFSEREPLLRYKKNTHRLGVRVNFATAIGEAQGDYIACCDQDDIWEPFKLERLLATLLEQDAVLVHSDATLIGQDGNLLSDSMFKTYQFSTDLSVEDYILHANNVTGCTMLFSSSLRSKLYPFPPCYYYHDRWIAIVASLYGGIAFCPEPLIRYRQHASNLSATLGGGGMSINQRYFREKAKGLFFVLKSYKRLKYRFRLLPLLLKDCLFALFGLALLKEKLRRGKRGRDDK